MRILLIARDYPRSGIDAPSPEAACDALTQTGHDVVVVTREGQRPAAAPARTIFAGEYPPMLAGFDDAAWLLQANIAMFERAAAEMNAHAFDVVHAIGGAVAHATVSMRRAYDVPVVASIVPGRGDPAMEAWLLRDAAAIIVPSPAAASRASRPVRVVRAGPGYAARLLAVYREAVHAGLSPVSR